MDLKLADESAKLAIEIKAVLERSGSGWSNDGGDLHDMIERVEAIIRRTPPGMAPTEWELTAAGLRVLASEDDSLRIARTGDGDLLQVRARGEVFTQEFRRRLSADLFSPPRDLEDARRALLEGHSCNLVPLRLLLASIPLRTLYWSAEQPRPSFGGLSEKPAPGQEPMVRAIVFLDQEPVASPQFLNQGVLYGLTFRLQGLGWPDNAVRLRINLNTTCPPEVYAVSDFAMDRPTHIADSQFEGNIAGHISFQCKQSNLLDDLVFTVHAAFEALEGHLNEIPVIGHNELRIKVVDTPSWLPTTETTPLHQRIVELISDLIGEHPSIRQELPDLFPMLQALGRICAVYAQEAAFKGRTNVSEREFQKKVVHDLRLTLPTLEVQEHSQQAGGITDIRFRSVIVELKVEDENGERGYLAQKYSAQVTQYAGVEARQVSVLLILDLTEKVNPPGDIKNDIFLSDVPTHGTGAVPQGFPSKVFVFVVDGNTRNPSSYSR